MPPGEIPKIMVASLKLNNLANTIAIKVLMTNPIILKTKHPTINFRLVLKKLNGNLLPNDQPIQS